MTSDQCDIILAGIAVRGWPTPFRVMPHFQGDHVVWLWPAHTTCPARHRNAETGEIQEFFAGMLLLEDDGPEEISRFFADVDRDFDYWGFNPATGAFYKGL